MRIVWAAVGALFLTGGLLLIADRNGPLREGDVAPDFSARLSTGETFALSDYAGKKNVVLFFYPKDFTSGCTKQVCLYRDNYREVQQLGGVLFGVSSDSDSSHGAFIDTYGLPFPLISDPDRAISKAYGAERWGGALASLRRVTYVIDKQGIVRKVAHHEFMIQRHIEDVIEALKKLQK